MFVCNSIEGGEGFTAAVLRKATGADVASSDDEEEICLKRKQKQKQKQKREQKHHENNQISF